ncbi:MAG TPA: hypothetical protein VFB07_06420 [Vicinamibacterales bacterium]|nr:hypothetical protein [Vicinamibacterales bacterium]
MIRLSIAVAAAIATSSATPAMMDAGLPARVRVAGRGPIAEGGAIAATLVDPVSDTAADRGNRPIDIDEPARRPRRVAASGFLAIGAAIAQASEPVALGFGAWGLARSAWVNVPRTGRNVVLPEGSIVLLAGTRSS